jgi:hypothetical protein
VGGEASTVEADEARKFKQGDNSNKYGDMKMRTDKRGDMEARSDRQTRRYGNQKSQIRCGNEK